VSDSESGVEGVPPALRAAVFPKPLARRLDSAFHPRAPDGQTGFPARLLRRFTSPTLQPRSTAPAPPLRAGTWAPSPCGGVLVWWGCF